MGYGLRRSVEKLLHFSFSIVAVMGETKQAEASLDLVAYTRT